MSKETGDIFYLLDEDPELRVILKQFHDDVEIIKREYLTPSTPGNIESVIRLEESDTLDTQYVTDLGTYTEDTPERGYLISDYQDPKVEAHRVLIYTEEQEKETAQPREAILDFHQEQASELGSAGIQVVMDDVREPAPIDLRINFRDDTTPYLVATYDSQGNLSAFAAITDTAPAIQQRITSIDEDRRRRENKIIQDEESESLDELALQMEQEITDYYYLHELRPALIGYKNRGGGWNITAAQGAVNRLIGFTRNPTRTIDDEETTSINLGTHAFRSTRPEGPTTLLRLDEDTISLAHLNNATKTIDFLAILGTRIDNISLMEKTRQPGKSWLEISQSLPAYFTFPTLGIEYKPTPLHAE